MLASFMHSATLLCNVAWSDTLQPSCCGFQALCGILEYLRGKKFRKLTCFLYPMKVSKTIMLWFDKIMVCETVLGGAWNRSRVARHGSFSKTQQNTFVLFSALFCFISSFLLPLCGWRWQSVMAQPFLSWGTMFNNWGFTGQGAAIYQCCWGNG